eukprot:Pgem_evm1s13560
MTQTSLSGKISSVWFEQEDLDMNNKFWACYYDKLSNREIGFKYTPPNWLREAIVQFFQRTNNIFQTTAHEIIGNTKKNGNFG